jgi:hypothetical protein
VFLNVANCTKGERMKRLFLLLVLGSTGMFATTTSAPVVKDETDKTDIFAIPLDTDEQEEKINEQKLEKLEQRIENKRAGEAQKKAT